MATSSRATARSSGPVLPSSFSAGGGGSPFHRSTYSANNRHSTYYSSSTHGSSNHGFASYSFSTTQGSSSGGFFSRSASPTRVNLPPSSMRVSLDSRSISPRGRPLTGSPSSFSSVSATATRGAQSAAAAARAQPRRTCMCSPTTHPGSFRCALHKNNPSSVQSGYASSSNRLHARRSAMTNSLVRIGTVEGDLVKRALAALIRPSSHQQRRRAAFQPKPSRLSAMSRAEVVTAAA